MTYPRAVLFDHDGTLVDTEPQWAAAKRHVAGTHQQSWDTEDDHATLGGTVQDAARLMVERGATDSVEEITRQLAEHVIGSMDHEVPFLPGIPSLLRELKEAGTPAAIVTNALGSVARTTSAGAPDVLTRIVSHDDVSRAKPDPEPYLAGARLLGVPPRDCVAMEDSEPGVESAVAAGMTVVVVPGDKPVPEGPHRVFVDAHEDVTLDFLRSLTPPA